MLIGNPYIYTNKSASAQVRAANTSSRRFIISTLDPEANKKMKKKRKPRVSAYYTRSADSRLWRIQSYFREVKRENCVCKFAVGTICETDRGKKKEGKKTERRFSACGKWDSEVEAKLAEASGIKKPKRERERSRRGTKWMEKTNARGNKRPVFVVAENCSDFSRPRISSACTYREREREKERQRQRRNDSDSGTNPFLAINVLLFSLIYTLQAKKWQQKKLTAVWIVPTSCF